MNVCLTSGLIFFQYFCRLCSFTQPYPIELRQVFYNHFSSKRLRSDIIASIKDSGARGTSSARFGLANDLTDDEMLFQLYLGWKILQDLCL